MKVIFFVLVALSFKALQTIIGLGVMRGCTSDDKLVYMSSQARSSIEISAALLIAHFLGACSTPSDTPRTAAAPLIISSLLLSLPLLVMYLTRNSHARAIDDQTRRAEDDIREDR